MAIEIPNYKEDDNQTIDILVDYYSLTMPSHLTTFMSVYEYLINYKTENILRALKSKLNKPSKHDLHIISEANKFDSFGDKNGEEKIKKIIQIYKDRKELQ